MFFNKEEDKEGNRAAEPEEEAAADTVRPKILTESELNALSAKMVKAEIMGNDDLVEAGLYIQQKLFIYFGFNSCSWHSDTGKKGEG